MKKLLEELISLKDYKNYESFLVGACAVAISMANCYGDMTQDEKEIVMQLATKEEMYQRASEIALEFRRTEVAICKQIEIMKQWFWSEK